MSVLHAYFHLRKQNEFQRCLEQSKAATSTSYTGQLSPGSGSGPSSKSLTRLSSTSANSVDVNARDWLGRTVLHLACSALDPAALEFVRLLLSHPYINVNIQDHESNWSALHRALYAGNIQAAVLLVQRNDVDMYMKDAEGYTPFDLYNSTVQGTNPPRALTNQPPTELYMWGSNRNAALGLAGDNDRSTPEQIIIKREGVQHTNTLCERLRPVSVLSIGMSKLHTTIITAESTSNLRSCGFASDGRLGPGVTTSHLQFGLINPQSSLSHTITAIALGQDHTLAVNAAGEVLSWGLNRFSQLGYIIEGSARALEAQVQASARKITGPLRNQTVIGVATCKSASACWTSKQLFTWGTNGGQLGYEKATQPQVLPRLVPYVNEPVVSVAMTESAMLILLESKDVLCIHDNAYWKLPFVSQRRSSKPRHKEKVEIQQLTACESSMGSFALVSEIGDVYLFNVDDTSVQKKDTSTKDGVNRRPQPQLVWSVRKQFLAVKDVALGSDGSMILCTNSGHVFVRSRNTRSTLTAGAIPSKNAQSFKVQRIPQLQRVIKVCANSTGAFAALRHDAIPSPISLDARTLAEDLASIQPVQSFLRTVSAQSQEVAETKMSDEEILEQSMSLLNIQDAEEDPDTDIAKDIHSAIDACRFLTLASGIHPFFNLPSALSEHHGADVVFRVGNFSIPVHRSILLARAPALSVPLNNQRLHFNNGIRTNSIVFDGTSNKKKSRYRTITVSGCLPMTILIFCHYLYTDKLVALWDRRVALAITDRFPNLELDPARVKDELKLIASQQGLRIPHLENAATSAGKVLVKASMNQDLTGLYERTQKDEDGGYDVVVILRDARIKAHSAVLRARSPYFATFFDEECWASERFSKGGGGGAIDVDLNQFSVRPMAYLFKYFYGDVSGEVFDDIDFAYTTDQLIDFIFEVISCSNHLLTVAFTDICSSVILQLVDLSNVSYILVEAVHLNATALVDSLHGYMAKNLETLIEAHALDELPQHALKCFSTFVQNKQDDHHPYIRKGGNLAFLEKRWTSWINLQDFPTPFIPRYLSLGLRGLSALTAREPPTPLEKVLQEMKPSSPPTTRLIAHPKRLLESQEDELFPMDTDLSQSPLLPAPSTSPTVASNSAVWKGASIAHKVDMKSIMEAEQQAADSKRPRVAQPATVEPRLIPWKSRTVASNVSQSSISSGRPGSGPKEAAAASSSPIESRLSATSNEIQSPSRPAGSPWKIVASTSTTPTENTSRKMDTRRSNISFGTTLHTPTKSSPAKHELGPLIVPAKGRPVEDASMRRSSSGEGKAWSSSAAKPIAPVVPSKGPVSFAAIQEQQASKPVARGPLKSLREIQEEEQEAAFLTWFEEESAKIQAQEAAMLANAMSAEKSSGKRTGKAGRGRGMPREGGGHGRGRGKSRAPAAAS